MSKKVSLFIIFSIVIGLLGGCQLAKNGEKDGAGESQVGKNDKFIGVYISYMEDDSNIQVGSLAKYADENDKIYAKLVEVESDDGIKSHEFVFGEGEGISFFNAIIPESMTGMPDYIAHMGSYNIIYGSASSKNSVLLEENTNETILSETTHELEGSLYFTEDVIVYVYSVYQKLDGDVYCLWDTMGVHIGSDSNSTQTFGDSESTLVKLHMKCKAEVGVTKFIGMNDESEVIWTTKYDTNEVPEQISIPTGVKYIIHITEYENYEPDTKVYTKDDVYIDIVKNGKGITMESFTCKLVWSE